MPLNTLGSNREHIELAIADRDQLIQREVLVGDPRRWRPRWFDGRFLAAADLQAEQNYFLVRQADLGRAGGSGVIDGLMVSEVRGETNGLPKLRIEAGQGVTDSGELVVLFDALSVNPADIPEMQRLDAAFGLQMIPNEGGRTRTGLYVLALRPVEWTAYPIGAYPTSLTGTRSAEDSTLVEGVAVSLIPYPEQTTDDRSVRRRARVAREIFVEGRDRGLTSGVLPLAMVALRGNLVEWIDPFMVRRETGAERPAGMDFGFGARAVREAHLLQYQRHLADAFNAQNDRAFAATAYFDVLPPAGQFPSATMDPDRLTHQFFPPGIEVELSFIPEDELAAAIEESLLLPPIDLTAGFEGLTGTGVIVLVPVTRADFAANRAALPNWDAELPRLRPAFLDIRARATPRDLLLSRIFVSRPPALPPITEEEPWRKLLRAAKEQRLLWYVRRRHLPIPSNVAGTPVSADSPRVINAPGFIRILGQDPVLNANFDRLRLIGAPEVDVLTRRLTEARFVEHPGLLRSVLVRAAGPEGATLTAETAVNGLAVAADPALGEGLARLTGDSGPADRAMKTNLDRALRSDRVADTGAVADVDRLAREVPEDKFVEFATALASALKPGENIPNNVAALRKKFVR